MLGAWQYAVAGVEAGATATATYADFLAGGGHIRTSDWYYLSRQATASKLTGDLVQGLPFETPIPSQAYTTVETDYGQKYVTVADIKYVEPITGATVRRTITVANDEIKPWVDLEHDITDVGAGYGGFGGAAGVEVVRTRFYSPRWIEW